MKKNLLIISGLAFLTTVIFLGLYSYQINNFSVKNNLKKEIIEKEKVIPVSVADRAEEIKQRIEQEKINNQSFQNIDLLEKDCDEDAKKYSEELVSGTAKTAEGEVLEINTSRLTLEFIQGTYKWISDVVINSDTSISIVNSPTDIEKAFFSNIKIGDKIVVNSRDSKVVEDNFIAESIFILQ